MEALSDLNAAWLPGSPSVAIGGFGLPLPMAWTASRDGAAKWRVNAVQRDLVCELAPKFAGGNLVDGCHGYGFLTFAAVRGQNFFDALHPSPPPSFHARCSQ